MISADDRDSSEPKTVSIAFTEITPDTGVDVVAHNGESAGYRSILETLGAGVAVSDFDGDLLPDLLFPQGGTFGNREVLGTHLRVFRNRREMIFDDVTDQAASEHESLFSHGIFSTDFDNDGWTDFLVTGYGLVLLYHNQGDGTFLEVAESSGLQPGLWSTGAAWGDFDGDGNADLYVVRYVDWSFQNHPDCLGFGGTPDLCSPAEFEALQDRVFRNNGDGTFGNYEPLVELAEAGKGLAALAGDVDLDGDIDVYVANDTTPNLLFVNRDGALTDMGIASGTAFGTRATADGSMGVELADLTLNGRPDIWVTNYEHQNFALYRNDAAVVFQHASDRLGIAAVGTVYVGFGTIAADFDLDGDEDLSVANGHVMLHSTNSPLQQQPLLFENNEGHSFRNIANTVGGYFGRAHRGRGMAVGDLDQDGDPDLVVTHCNQPATILRNDAEGGDRSVSVRLTGRWAARIPVGATLTLKTTCGGQTRFVKSGTGFLSSSDEVVTFSLPSSEDVADLEVRLGDETYRHSGIGPGQYTIFQDPQRSPYRCDP